MASRTNSTLIDRLLFWRACVLLFQEKPTATTYKLAVRAYAAVEKAQWALFEEREPTIQEIKELQAHGASPATRRRSRRLSDHPATEEK